MIAAIKAKKIFAIKLIPVGGDPLAAKAEVE
jgi:hypothetical protein